MNRRDFFHPRQVAKVAGPVLGIADEIAPDPAPTDPVLLRFSRRAMATTFEVILPFGADQANDVAGAALDEIDRLEAQLTVYRDSSEVSRLNATAAHRAMRVEPNLFNLLSLAERMHRETEGAFDIAIGALIKTWGFFRRQGRMPTSHQHVNAREQSGWAHVLLNADRQTVSFRKPGVEINLGSIGKGYALDCALAVARELGDASNIFLHGGHSSLLAQGDGGPDRLGWAIGLTDPRNPTVRRATVHLRNRAMATSAATQQHFIHEGRTLGHLLDPRSGWPAEGMLSATATAPIAAEADALATAFFILGIEKTRAFCEAHPEVGAVLIAANSPHRLEVLGRARDEVDVGK